MGWLKHEHEWGVWRWRAEFLDREATKFIRGEWIRYCKHCAGFQVADEESTPPSTPSKKEVQ